MTDTRSRRRGAERRQGEVRHAKDCESRGRIPAGELGVKDRPIVPAHMQPIVSTDRPHRCEHQTIAVDETACRTPLTLHLDDRCRHGVHGICHLSREFIHHGAMVADTVVAIITRTGRNGHALRR